MYPVTGRRKRPAMTQPSPWISAGWRSAGATSSRAWRHSVDALRPARCRIPAPPDRTAREMLYRPGFRVPVAGNAIGGVRELAGNSAALINGMNALHTAFEAAPEAAMGKIPVVKMTIADQRRRDRRRTISRCSRLSRGSIGRTCLVRARSAPPAASAPVNVPVSQMPPAQVAAMAAASVPAQQGTARAARAPAMADLEMPF